MIELIYYFGYFWNTVYYHIIAQVHFLQNAALFSTNGSMKMDKMEYFFQTFHGLGDDKHQNQEKKVKFGPL